MEDDARSSGSSSPDSIGSVETSISSHFGGSSYPISSHFGGSSYPFKVIYLWVFAVQARRTAPAAHLVVTAVSRSPPTECFALFQRCGVQKWRPQHLRRKAMAEE
ncbi:hypothetical protein BUALT_Bualt09G0050300 [Buddleja alternifolia]|uniref:Uncharacterized protein n=1 Tax=Buddleja alternifolia TaxID=168488 RepID=A0AAV6XAX6_9LAMI|nr:hypothetical protein BUALT_Bualt09G0050300 [Buddleja alternifolia]